jgi:hypothetical protein
MAPHRERPFTPSYIEGLFILSHVEEELFYRDKTSLFIYQILATVADLIN